MTYLKFLFTKRVWAVIVCLLIIMFLTVGLPSNTGWHTVREIENSTERFFAILLLITIAVASLLQVHNEFKRPKK
jgi:predicted cation transporter